VTKTPGFEELLVEGAEVPVEGWDFSWFAGRATEQRPSWGYARLMGARMAEPSIEAALDVQTGGGEVLAGIPRPPARLAATESWPPNIAIARRNLAKVGATVVECADNADLPFPAETFDLVVSRHPVTTRWDEVARVLKPGGTYFAQHVGAGTVRELTDFMMGPQPVHRSRRPDLAHTKAESAGLTVVDLRSESLPMRFNDVAAVAVFLRKVIWIVPGFTVDAYRDRLAAMHEHIQSRGPFPAHSERFLIEARKPA
jgi:SAM-dependent methyltransferase